jgi:hypothetical protein
MWWAIEALMLGGVACGGEETSSGSGQPPACVGEACRPPVQPASCPAELGLAADGVGCEAVLPAAACPAGTMPRLGSTECMPVGWTDCPEGFALDDAAGGRGCRALIPPRACSGAARDALGGACLPVGDCAAAFPPREATYFVDDSYGPDDLDETHFDDIVLALQAAPAGAVVAIESGTYSAIVQLVEPVTLVGRCAGEVTLVGDDEHLGFLVSAVSDVVLRGLTLGHFVGAVAVDEGGSVTIEDSVFEGNGVVAVFASGAGSRVSLSRSVVRGTVAIPAARNPGAGVLVQDGARAEISESALVGNALSNLTVFEAGSEARVERSVLRDGVLQSTGAFTGDGGYGLYAYRGGRADVVETAIRSSATAGIQVMRASESSPDVVSHLDVQRSDITGVTDNAIGGVGRAVTFLEGATGAVSSSTLGDGSDGAVLVATGASATISGSTVLGAVTVEPVSGHGIFVEGGTLDVQGTVVTRHRWAAFGVAGAGGVLTVRESLAVEPVAGHGKPNEAGAIGAYAIGGATAELEATSFVDPVGAGLLADGAGTTLRATGVLVSGPQPNDSGYFGRGAIAQNGGAVEMDRSALGGLREVGVLLADGGASLRLNGSTIGPTALASDGVMGHGIVAYGGSRLILEDTTVASSASIGMVLSASGAFVRGSFIKGNAVGVQVQDGSVLLEADAASSEPGAVVISSDTSFVANGSRVGSGVIALPAPVGE